MEEAQWEDEENERQFNRVSTRVTVKETLKGES
jgi:hypothetical protein